MRKNAQSIIEMAILAAIVAVITVATFTIYNNNKVSLVKMSEVTLHKQ